MWAGQTPQSSAAKYGHLAIVKQLLEAGADVDSKNTDGWTPLSIASKLGHSDVVKVTAVV